MTDLPIVCTLTPDALRARRAGLLSDLLQRAEGREDIADGLLLRFAPAGETLATIARAIEGLRRGVTPFVAARHRQPDWLCCRSDAR